MKKVYTILCTFVLCALFTGCSDDDEQTTSEFKVISTTAKFDAYGGEGKIEVQATSTITATADDTWCTVAVSGRTVAVTVPTNATLVGRTTMITVTSGSQSLRVPVYQAGDAFTCDLTNHLFPTDGGSSSFTVKTTREYTVNAPDWISYTIQDQKIVFTAEATEVDRSAQVTITSGQSNAVTATFSQQARMLVEGTYAIAYTNAQGVASTGSAVITQNEDGTYNMATQGMILNANIKIRYSVEARLLTIPVGQLLGYVSGYAAYLCAFSEDNFLSWDTSIQYIANGVFDENDNIKFTFKDGGTWKDKNVIGLYYAPFDKPIEDGGTWQRTSWGRATNLVLTKVP